MACESPACLTLGGWRGRFRNHGRWLVRPRFCCSSRLIGAPGAERGRVDVPQCRDLLGGEGPLAADIAGEGQPPGEHGAEAVPESGHEGDVNEQPDPPADEAANLERP